MNKLPDFDLLFPNFDKEYFFKHCWDKDYYHLKGNNLNINSYLNYDSYFELLKNTNIPKELMEVPSPMGSKKGEYFHSKPDLSLIDPSKILKHLKAKKGSLILSDLQKFHQPSEKLACEFEKFHNSRADVQVFFTFAGKNTLPVHWDTEGVFVVQVAGTKKWEIYKPVLNKPLANQHSSTVSHEIEGDDPVLFETILSPGDLLYIPRGLRHRAIALDMDSIHYTVGANCKSWYIYYCDVLNDLIRDMANSEAFRNYMPNSAEAPEYKKTNPLVLEEVIERLKKINSLHIEHQINRDLLLKKKKVGHFDRIDILCNFYRHYSGMHDEINFQVYSFHHFVEIDKSKATFLLRSNFNSAEFPLTFLPVIEHTLKHHKISVKEIKSLYTARHEKETEELILRMLDNEFLVPIP